MKKTVLSGLLLTLLFFITPTVLQAVPDPSLPQAPSTGPGQALPEVKTYDELRHAISEARAQSRGRVEQAVEKERVREAWEIGRLIDAHVLQHKERADYGEKVLERLATDLGISHTELKYMLQFARAYPMGRPADQLSWSHYEALLAVNDPEKREALAERTEKEGWSRDRLRQEVRNVTKGDRVAPEEVPLMAQPGKPGTYRVIQAFAGPYKGQRALDLGFSNYYRPSGPFPFKDRDIVESAKGKLKRSSRTEVDLFTYEADVYRVLDGDTIMAVVDLGFGITTTQTLRLRGIDAPEIQTRDGMEAKVFLEQMLRSTEAKNQEKSLPLVSGLSASPVLIRTVKSDKYDRYLADVYFLDAKGQEVYLNNLLLEKGMAVRVRE